jgi:hypothetical protein
VKTPLNREGKGKGAPAPQHSQFSMHSDFVKNKFFFPTRLKEFSPTQSIKVACPNAISRVTLSLIGGKLCQSRTNKSDKRKFCPKAINHLLVIS